MKKLNKVADILLIVFLAGMMVYGGIGKFTKPIPSPAQVVEKANTLNNTQEKEHILKIVLYVNGLKQTGYFWQFLAVMEITLGLLLFLPKVRFLSSILLLSITSNILLFHIFLEPNEIGDLLMTLGLFGVNIFLILKEKDKVKSLFL